MNKATIPIVATVIDDLFILGVDYETSVVGPHRLPVQLRSFAPWPISFICLGRKSECDCKSRVITVRIYMIYTISRAENTINVIM